jgi:hypothetical protein
MSFLKCSRQLVSEIWVYPDHFFNPVCCQAAFNKLHHFLELRMKPLILKTAIALALAAASLSASAVGRIADVQVFDRNTRQNLPVHYHRGEYWVAGQPGAKYAIQIRNSRGPRILAVTSVDGLNVLSGETADFSQSGYVFGSGQRYGIEGWRKSDAEIAAFVFTASGDSYAERVGKPRDMGVIGVALFRERAPVAVYSPPVLEKRQEAPAPAAAPSAESSKHSGRSADLSSAAPAPTPKLGTAHGERETSVVSHTQFIRNSPQPDEIIRIRYDSHANLVAMGVLPHPRHAHGHPTPNAFPGAAASYVPDPPAWR